MIMTLIQRAGTQTKPDPMSFHQRRCLVNLGLVAAVSVILFVFWDLHGPALPLDNLLLRHEEDTTLSKSAETRASGNGNSREARLILQFGKNGNNSAAVPPATLILDLQQRVVGGNSEQQDGILVIGAAQEQKIVIHQARVLVHQRCPFPH